MKKAPLRGILVVHHKHKETQKDARLLKGKQLTIHERRQIQRWKLEGRSNREIARLLGKAP